MSDNVVRYNFWSPCGEVIENNHPNGDWVKYEDYAVLAERVKVLEEVAEAITKKPKYGQSLIDKINNALLQNCELPLRTKLNSALKKAGKL